MEVTMTTITTTSARRLRLVRRRHVDLLRTSGAACHG
jgi:hypothetical protein